MDETATEAVTEAPEGTVEAPQVDAAEPESFDKEYVSKLRSENAERRTAATEATKRAEDLSRQLFLAKVKATGKLADPADQPYDPNLVGDDEALAQAIDDTLLAHPHWASRRPTGNIGQGVIEQGKQPFSLTQHLKTLV